MRTAFGRYLLTGSALFLTDLALFLSLTCAGIAPGAAQLASRGTGALIGFIAHKRYVFASVGATGRRLFWQGGGYGLLMLAGVLLSPFVLALMLWLSTGRLLIAKLGAEVLMACLNFVAMRWLFRARAPRAGAP